MTYWLHIEVADLRPRFMHEKVLHAHEVELYGAIAAEAARRVVDALGPSICTIAKRPDGRLIILRRAWSDEDEATPRRKRTAAAPAETAAQPDASAVADAERGPAENSDAESERQ